MSLTIALATRGRAPSLKRTLDRTIPNLFREDTRLLVLVDEDDEETLEAVLPSRVEKFIRPRPDSVGAKFNAAVQAAPADVYLAMVDYVAYVTPGFDQKILDANVFPDGIGVIYNHMANLSFPYMNAVTQGYVDAAGGMYPEDFPYWFVDHWLDDIARMIDRIAVADVRPFSDFKPPTQSHREPAFWATLFDCLMLERRRIARRIIDSPEFLEPEWRKTLLRSAYPLIEERSLMVNNMVKGMAALDTTTDERYERIRARAVETMNRCIPELEAAA